MDPDKELALLEQEFPKSSRAWIRDTPIALDDRIMSLAASHARYLQARYELKQQLAKLGPDYEQDGMLPRSLRPPKGFGPGVRFNLIPPVQESASEASFRSQPLSISRSQGPPSPPGSEKLLAMLRGAPRREWLNQISSIVLLGDIDLAIYLLREYRDRFLGK